MIDPAAKMAAGLTKLQQAATAGVDDLVERIAQALRMQEVAASSALMPSWAGLVESERDVYRLRAREIVEGPQS